MAEIFFFLKRNKSEATEEEVTEEEEEEVTEEEVTEEEVSILAFHASSSAKVLQGRSKQVIWKKEEKGSPPCEATVHVVRQPITKCFDYVVMQRQHCQE